MRLSEFVAAGPEALAPAALASDRELVCDLQGQLSLAGLLDPPVDGLFGPVTGWALGELARRGGLDFAGPLNRPLGDLLLNRAAGLLPLGDDDGLAGRIVGAMRRRGYWLSRHPGCLNIVYVEGLSPDGQPNDNAPNAFNDLRLLLNVGDDGRPTVAASWEATTEPGRPYEEHPLDAGGAARIAFGQYKSWIVGVHRAGTPGAHEALVQVDEITICRDLNKDWQRQGDKRYTGLFGINQHWGYDLPKNDVGAASAGCLVGRTRDGHRAFMEQLKSDARYRMSGAYRFMTAVLPAAALTETAFDPSTPH
jgi:hypothetical protein